MTTTTEQNQEFIDEIKAMLTIDKPIKFEDVLSVKKTPHIELFRCWAVVKNKYDEVVVFDGENWYDLQPNQANVFHLLQSLKQRLITIL